MKLGAAVMHVDRTVTHMKPRLRGWLHVTASAVFSLLGLLTLALTSARPARRLAFVAYLVGTLAMFGTSALYHRGRWSDQQMSVWRRLDHSTIFLAIAGAYTAVAFCGLRGTDRVITLAVCWIGAAVGITLQWVPVHIPRALFTAVYVIVGWSITPFLSPLITRFGRGGVAMLIVGGLAYSGGAVVYARKRPDPRPATFGYHEVFHLMTIIGAGLHFTVIALIALPLR